MDQRYNDIFFSKITVEARTAPNQLIDFSCDLYAAEAGSYDDEVEMPAPAIGITGDLGGFHLTDDLLTKINGIAHNLEGKGVFAHPGNNSQIAFRAAGNHDVVIMQARQRALSVVELNL